MNICAHAQSPAITNALDWLRVNQKADGSWGVQSSFRDTTAVIDTYRILGKSDVSYQNALNWIKGASIESNDYVARRIISLAGTESDVAQDLQALLLAQNADGGWGYSKGFGVNIFDTVIVLQAFRAARFNQPEPITRSINYIISTQNVDGSWSLSPEMPGDIYATSLSVALLLIYGSPDAVAEPVNKGISWLKSRQNPDGGFGASPSTVQETAFALKALLASGQIQAESLESAVNYIVSSQLSDGSWSDRSFETAMALQILANLKPNLSILPYFLSISNSTPKSGEIVKITAIIRNTGSESGSNVPVQLFTQELGGQAVQLGPIQTIAFLPVGGSTTIEVYFDTKNKQGLYTVGVKIDPENTITELTKEDNQSSVQIAIRLVPDLAISDENIVLSKTSANIGDDVIVTATISNQGNNLAQNIVVAFYYDSPVFGNLFGTANVASLGPGETASRQFIWKANKVGPDVKIYVVIDPYKRIDELIRDNNQTFKPISVLAVTDANLTVSYKDITFNPPSARQGDSVDISATIKNEGFTQADFVEVAFYKGVPGTDGILLGNKIIQNIPPDSSSTVSFNWSNITESGETLIYIKVDPSNTVQEYNEIDNDAFTTLIILGLPDLVISTNSIAFSPAAPKDGDTVSIEVTVQNKGEQGAANVSVRTYEGSTIIGTQVIPLLPGNSQTATSFTYDTTGKSGVHQMTVIVDPDNAIPEQSEENNTASRTFGVQDANLWLTEKYISPNGDGIKDSTQFFFRLNIPQTVKIIIADKNDEIVRIFSGAELENTIGGNIIWNGFNDDGMVVDDGLYQIKIVDLKNSITGSLPVIVDNNRSPLTDAIGTKYLLNNNITCQLPDTWYWKWFPDESGLLLTYFWNTSEYKAGLYTMAPDGENIQRITPGEWSQGVVPKYDYYYGKQEISQDGEKIALSLIRFDRSLRKYDLNQLWTVDRDGQHLTLLDSYELPAGSDAYNMDLKWSPYGNYIAYTMGSPSELFIIKTDGTGKMKIDTGGYINFSYLRWSPDNNNLAYPYSTYDLNGDPVRTIRLSDALGNKKDIYTSNGYIQNMEWLNSRKIIITETDTTTYLNRLWIIDASGDGNNKELTDDLKTKINISPDRKSIAFTSSVDNAVRLNISDELGNSYSLHEIKTTETGFVPQLWNIVWSPDNSKIAFTESIVPDIIIDSTSGANSVPETNVPYLVVIDLPNKKESSFAIPYSSINFDRWLSDNVSITGWDYNNGYSIYAINSATGETEAIVSDVFLYENELVSPLERYITYYKGVEVSSGCYGSGSMDLWVLSSLLNLTADLRVSKQKSAVVLKGIAADLNFEGYMLEYADAKNPTQWNLIAPPSDIPVIDDEFTMWVPPYEGIFYVRLTMWDKAGNVAWDIKIVSWGISSSVTNLYKTLDLFSPNGDGIKDTVELHYKVLEPVHLEFNIYDVNNNLIRIFTKDHPSPVADYITWDGRDENNRVAPDGKYKIKVFDYEFFVEVDNTPPAVNIAFGPFKVDDQTNVDLLALALDKNVEGWIIEYGEGDFPEEWYEYRKGSGQLKNSSLFPPLEETITTYSGAYIEWLIGKKFKITAEDFAGNRTIAVSNFLNERIILDKWDGKSVTEIPLDLYRPGPHSIGGIETIKAPIDSINVQFWMNGQWVDSPPVMNPLSGMLDLSWDNSYFDPYELYKIRIKAIDIFGKEYYSKELGPRPLLLIDSQCDLTKLLVAGNFMYEDLRLLKLQVKSNKDVNYSQWTDYFIYDSAKGDAIPAGKFYPPPPNVQPGMEYLIRMLGVTISGKTYLSVSSMGAVARYPSDCIKINLGYRYKEADCGLTSNKAEILSTIYSVNMNLMDKAGNMSLTYYIQKPDGLQFLRQINPFVEGTWKNMTEISDSFIIDTSNLIEGDNFLKAVLTYKDLIDNSIKEISANSKLAVDHILPVARITYPLKSTMLCPVKINDANGDWYGINVEGIATDNNNVESYKLFYGIGENPSVWIPAVTGTANPIEGSEPVQGNLGMWNVTDLRGSTFSLKLEVTDTAGNKNCYTTKVQIDTLVDITNLSINKSIFSPNGDGVLDDINISYEIDEYATVDVKVLKLLKMTNGTYDLDSASVRTIVSGLQHLFGTENTVWDGKDDSGVAVPDGKYGIAVLATDSCGNSNVRWTSVEVDNTKPAAVISYPMSGGNIGNIVEVKGTANDQHFQGYTLEAGIGENPDTWVLISSNTTPVSNGFLSEWNTFGLDGRWTLRLSANDTVGNKNTAAVALDLGARRNLIKDLDAAPRLFSPNSDGKLDTANITYELTEACQVRIEILDSSGLIRKTYPTSVLSSGIFNFSWNGGDDAGVVVSDGDYTVKLGVELSSDASVTQEEIITVVVDSTPPAVNIEQPVNNSYLKTDVFVTGTISDNNLLEYFVTNTGDAGPAVIDNANQSREDYAFGTLKDLPEGNYVLDVRAKDHGENTTDKNIVFTIDRTLPKVTLDTPKDGEYYGSDKETVNISGAIVEKNLETYSLRYGSGDNPAQWVELLGGNTIPVNPQLFLWNVGRNDGIPDGSYTVSLYAKDKAGSESEIKVKVKIDNTPPVTAITSLQDGDYIKTATDIRGTASDASLDKYTVEISEGNCSDAYKWAAIMTSSVSVNNGLLVAWQTLPPDGDYCLRLTATDKLGNKSETKVNVKVDTHPPAAPVLEGEIENRTNTRLNWTANKESDLAGYNIYRDNQKINDGLITETSFLDQNRSEGIYIYTVKAVDLAGWESESSNEAKLKIDLTGPNARISFPADASKVSGLVDIKGTAYSADDFRQYRVYTGWGLNPPIWNLIRTSPVPISYGSLAQWDTFALSEGLYSLKLEAEDLTGNITIYQALVTVDNTPPLSPVLISAIPNGSDVFLTWQANTEQDLAGYLLYRNDQLANVSGIVIGDLKPYLITGTTYLDKALPDGKFNYYLIAMDQAGNTSDVSNLLEVNIDTRPPRAAVVEPSDGSKFENTIFVKAESPDLDIASVQFQYKRAQDTQWINLGDLATQTPYMTYLDPVTLGLTFGNYNLRAIATDNGGKTDASPSYITVIYTDMTAPSAPIDLNALNDGKDVTLTWTANTEPDLKGYNIYRSSEGTKTKVNTSIVEETTYQDIDLSDGVHTYEVTAVDDYNNESSASNSVSVEIYAPKIIQPYTPSGQSIIQIEGAEAASNASVEVGVAGAEGYELRVTGTSDASGGFNVQGNLALGENRITAKVTDSAGNISRASDMVVVVYNEPPAAPTGLMNTVLDYNVSLSWDPNTEPDLSGYNLYRDGEKVNAPLPVTSGNISASSSYYWNPPLDAFDSDPSTYWMSDYGSDTFTPVWWQIDLPEPELINHMEIHWAEADYTGKDYEIQVWSGYAWITQVKVSGNTALDNTFDFSPSYRTEKIRIYITDTTNTGYLKQVGISEIEIMKDDLITQSSYDDMDLADGKYTHDVTAVDYYGFESLLSDAVQSAVGDVIAPSAPQDLTASASGSAVILGWNANTETDLTGYNVYRTTSGVWLKINTSLITGPTYIDSDLANGIYIYRITAVDTVGNESDPSNEASASVYITPPQPPVNLSLSVIPEGAALQAVWVYAGDAPAGYNIYRSTTSGGPYSLINDILLVERSYIDTGLSNSVSYYYVVVAFDSVGNESAYSSEVMGIPADSVAPSKPVIYRASECTAQYNGKTDISGLVETGVALNLFKDGEFVDQTLPLEKDVSQSLTFDYSGNGASLSPDGSTLAYSYNDSLWTMDISTANKKELLQDAYEPLWSPDGRKIAYAFFDGNWNYRIGIYDLNKGTALPLSTDPGVEEYSASWSSDGSKLTFISNRSGNSDIWLMDLSDKILTQVTNGKYTYSPRLSPDGSKIAYFVYSNLYVVDLISMSTIEIDAETDGSYTDWSSDGKELAFTSYRNGNADIFVFNLTANALRQITSDLSDESNPQWSPDGNNIIFERRAPDWSESVLIVNTQSLESRILQQNLYDLNDFDWTISGKIAYIQDQTLTIVALEGLFNFRDVKLNPGENTFIVQAVDQSGNAMLSDPVCIIYDTSLLPDFEISSDDIFLYPPFAIEGEEVAVVVAVKNKGQAEARDVDADIYIWDSSGNLELIKSDKISYLGPNSEQLIGLTLDSAEKSGINTILAVIDAEDRIPESIETNNFASKELIVMEEEGASIITALDSIRYGSNEDVNINITLLNSGTTQDVAAEIWIEDINGYTVTLLDTIRTSLSYGVKKDYSLVWNTGFNYAGSYKVHTILRDETTVLNENTVPFTILPDINLDATLVTNKATYVTGENVIATATIRNDGKNYIIPDLSVKMLVADAMNNILISDEKNTASLLPNGMVTLSFFWNTFVIPPGDYTLMLEVKDASGTVLSSKTASLTISSETRPSNLLSGQISVDKQSLLQGEPVAITYGITNIGNVDLSAINLSILTVHVVELSVYDTLTDQTSLLKTQTYTNNRILNTVNYTAKDYLVVLRANIAGVEETLAGTYFRVEGAPSAPSLYSPQNGIDMETLIPVLTVNNVSDPNDDDLTYQFEVYADSNMSNLAALSPMITEEINTTSWQLPLELQENQTYYWRVRAYDGLLYGEWMYPASFRVNIVNDPPTAPTLSSPADYSEVDTLVPVLTVNNASDPDSDNLTYNFELAYDSDFTQTVANEIGIFEGEGTTSWQAPVNLTENIWYYWRAQADDWFIEGPWMTTARFFINTANDAPTAPYIINPLEGSELTELYADITLSNSIDPDSAQLTYVFEIDTVDTFDSTGLISSTGIPEGQGATSWRAEGLSDNIYYYVRAKASDGSAESFWSASVRFFINTVNDAPTTPVLANPSNGSGVNAFSPTLSVHNSFDIDGDVLTYDFEVYEDASMTIPITSGTGIIETPQITSWTVPVSLTENTTYYWRARAYDGELYSNWMPSGLFMINTANDAPGAPLLNSPADGSSLDTLYPTLSVYSAVDPDSDTLSYDIEIYSGGVFIRKYTGIPQNASGITAIALTDALSDNTIYTWRARAYDGDRYGAWMNMATFSTHLPVTNITSTIDFDPNTLNKKSNGKWVVVYIELPAGYNIANILMSSILLNGTIPAEPWPYSLGDNDKDGIPDLMVKFNRNSVINLLPNGDKIRVEVTGTVGTTTFEGFDVIRVIP